MLTTKTKQFRCRNSLYQRKWLLSCYLFSYLQMQEQMLIIYLCNVIKHHYQVRTIKVLREQWTPRQRRSQKYYCPVDTLCKWVQLEWHFAIVPWSHLSRFFHLGNTCNERCRVAVRSVKLTFSHTLHSNKQQNTHHSSWETNSNWLKCFVTMVFINTNCLQRLNWLTSNIPVLFFIVVIIFIHVCFE